MPDTKRPVGCTAGWDARTEPDGCYHGNGSDVNQNHAGRNVALTALAGRLRAQGMDEGRIFNHLVSCPERRGLAESEVQTIARSIGAKPAGRVVERPRDGWPDTLHELADRRGWKVEALRALGAVADGAEVRFPMRNAAGAVVGWRRRRGDAQPFVFPDGREEKALTVKGGHNGFMSGWPIPQDDPVLMTEGEADAATALSAGHASTVGTPGAQPGGRCIGWLQQVLAGREVVLAPDPDDAGDGWRETIGAALQHAGATVWFIPPLPGQDLDKRLQREQDKPEALRALIECAIPWQPKATSATTAGGPADGPRPLTDLGNAERFADQHKGKVLFDSRLGRWRHWNEKKWDLDETGFVMRLAHKTARFIYSEAQRAKDSDTAAALAKWARRTESKERLSAMIDLTRALEGMTPPPATWDSAPWAMNVENGVIDLKSGKLRPHEPGDYFTKIAPANYDPGARHAILDKVLIDALPDEAERRYLQTLFGYALCGEKYEKILAFVFGPTDTAKSTVCDPFFSILGDYACTAEPDTFATKSYNSKGAVSPEVACLAGVRFVLTAETNENHKLDSGLIKRMTGGENIRARHPYGQSFEFRPAYLIVLQSNYRPIVSDADNALWNRLRVVPFDHVVPEEQKDKAVKETLEHDPAARSALLTWAVQGCLAWQSEGLAVPEAVKRATGQYREAMDPIGDFLTDVCVIGPNQQVSAHDLRAAYDTWARDNGVKYTLSPRHFAERLRARGCHDDRMTSGPNPGRKAWFGIGLFDGILKPTEVIEPKTVNFSMYVPHEEKLPEVTSMVQDGSGSALLDDPNAPEVADEFPF